MSSSHLEVKIHRDRTTALVGAPRVCPLDIDLDLDLDLELDLDLDVDVDLDQIW